LEEHAEFLLALIEERPDLTLDEAICAMRKCKIRGSRTAVWRFFQRHKITFKKSPACGGAGTGRRGARPAALDARTASENSVQIDSRSAPESEHHLRMIALGLLFLCLLCDRFKPRRQLEAEILALRHQLNILQRRAPGRPRLRWVDRALFIWLYRRCPSIVVPENHIRA
jgi:hypothetical protein